MTAPIQASVPGRARCTHSPPPHSSLPAAQRPTAGAEPLTHPPPCGPGKGEVLRKELWGFLLCLNTEQASPCTSISEIAASDTCPRRNFFREMKIPAPSPVRAPTPSPLPPIPHPTHTKATPKGTCRWRERGRDEERSWQCPSRHCLEKSSLPGGDGTPAVPQAGSGWQGHCRSDCVPSGPGSQEPFIA